ncbi:MAG: T9SS type A sorting domain-containing protein [Saprospiraceae bacterium]|nr:T9SS type A sorting domain-containing protein [Saprospiraceae bacterium]
MKNILALIWVFATVPVFAQKTLSPSLEPYKATLDQTVTKALQRAGFDLIASPVADAAPVVQNRSGQLQLDSTKSFFGYDFVGTDDTIQLFRTIYQYPQPTLEIHTEYQYEIDAWQTVSRSNIFKDNQDRIVEVLSEAFDPVLGDFVNDSRAVVFPHEDSPVLFDSFHVYGWDSLAMDWLLVFYGTNKFDAQDRLIESISSFDYFGQPLLLKDVYSYDANGDNTLAESFALFSGIEIPSGKREMEYQNHLLTQEIAFSDDGMGGLSAQSKTTYTYTSFDKVEQVNAFLWSLDINDWAQTQGDTYGYDNAQRVNSKETVIYSQDGSEERNLSKYDYVEDEKLKSEANYYWSVSDFFLSDRKFYYYSNGTLSEEEPHVVTPLALSPNPTSGLALLNLEEPALFQIYNSQGELVHSGAYQPNHHLNVSDLPSGMYFITARSEHEQFAGRLVKE